MFQAGDFIIGNEKNKGYFTGAGSICRVTTVLEFSVAGCDMEIYVIKGKGHGKIFS